MTGDFGPGRQTGYMWAGQPVASQSSCNSCDTLANCSGLRGWHHTCVSLWGGGGRGTVLEMLLT